MLTIETTMEDSDRLVNSVVMMTDGKRLNSMSIPKTKEVKARTEPKKKPQA